MRASQEKSVIKLVTVFFAVKLSGGKETFKRWNQVSSTGHCECKMDVVEVLPTSQYPELYTSEMK